MKYYINKFLTFIGRFESERTLQLNLQFQSCIYIYQTTSPI